MRNRFSKALLLFRASQPGTWVEAPPRSRAGRGIGRASQDEIPDLQPADTVLPGRCQVKRRYVAPDIWWQGRSCPAGPRQRRSAGLRNQGNTRAWLRCQYPKNANKGVHAAS